MNRFSDIYKGIFENLDNEQYRKELEKLDVEYDKKVEILDKKYDGVEKSLKDRPNVDFEKVKEDKKKEVDRLNGELVRKKDELMKKYKRVMVGENIIGQGSGVVGGNYLTFSDLELEGVGSFVPRPEFFDIYNVMWRNIRTVRGQVDIVVNKICLGNRRQYVASCWLVDGLGNRGEMRSAESPTFIGMEDLGVLQEFLKNIMDR